MLQRRSRGPASKPCWPTYDPPSEPIHLSKNARCSATRNGFDSVVGVEHVDEVIHQGLSAECESVEFEPPPMLRDMPEGKHEDVQRSIAEASQVFKLVPDLAKRIKEVVTSAGKRVANQGKLDERVIGVVVKSNSANLAGERMSDVSMTL